MPNYALVRNATVQNVIVANSPPIFPGFTAVLLTAGQSVNPGDSYNGSTFTPVAPSAAEIERNDVPERLRQIAATLAAWATDAKSAAEINAMAGAERIVRQAVIEDRVAKLARLGRDLILFNDRL